MEDKKKLYIEPELRETVLECEDVITASNTLATGLDGFSTTFTSAGTGLTYSNVYGTGSDK